MKTDLGSTELDKYIKKITERSSFSRATVEQVINTQIALLFGDLAVTGESECFLGNLKYDPQEESIKFDPNNVVLGITEGYIDPLVILREIFENV